MEHGALVEGLNPAQRDAVTYCDGPLLVLAGAGTGKTRVVTHKIAWLLREEGLPPWSLLAMTFTNKAAREMRERVGQLLGSGSSGLTVGTFHSVCAQLLRGFAPKLGYQSSFGIIDTEDQRRLMKRILKEAFPREAGKDLDKRARVLGGLADQWANEGFRAMSGEGAAVPRDKAWAVPLLRRYAEAKQASGVMDFGDLLLHMLHLLQHDREVAAILQARFRYVLVDEFQDTNKAQMLLVRGFLGGSGKLCVVGDDDQSIYGWRGARVENILHLDRDFPDLKVISLEENYRSNQIILDAAWHAIRKNPHIREKKLWTSRGKGRPIRLIKVETEMEEARKVCQEVKNLHKTGLPFSEMAVFYRTNAQSRSFEDQMRYHNIPHKVVGGQRFFERMEIKDILAYARLLANPADQVSFDRAVNTPSRGIGPATISRILGLAVEHRVNVMAAARILAAEPRGRGVAPVREFVELMDRLEARRTEVPLVSLFTDMMNESGYTGKLKEDGSLEAEGRLENLSQLLTSVLEYQENADEPTLEQYLENITLRSDTDELEDDGGYVTLMTVHSSKGLEFDAVFLTGMEEGLFPHGLSQEERGIEEERRLFHVAITRARDRLFFTLSASRAKYGRWEFAMPSPFLREIPQELMSDGTRLVKRRSLGRMMESEDRTIDYTTSQVFDED